MEFIRQKHIFFTHSKPILSLLLFFISTLSLSLLWAAEEIIVENFGASSTPQESAAVSPAGDDANQQIDSSIPSENFENKAQPNQEKPSLTQKVMPVYGNWCGANHPKDMSVADDPIDLLDQACKKHDVCYENDGYLNCACDDAINQELITGLKENQFGKTEAMVARSFHLYFNGSPCNGDHSTKVGPSRLIHNVVKKASDRTVDVITSLPILGDKIEEQLSN